MFANSLRIPVAVPEQKFLAPGKLLHRRDQPQQEPIHPLQSRSRSSCLRHVTPSRNREKYSLGTLPPDLHKR